MWVGFTLRWRQVMIVCQSQGSYTRRQQTGMWLQAPSMTSLASTTSSFGTKMLEQTVGRISVTRMKATPCLVLTWLFSVISYNFYDYLKNCNINISCRSISRPTGDHNNNNYNGSTDFLDDPEGAYYTKRRWPPRERHLFHRFSDLNQPYKNAGNCFGYLCPHNNIRQTPPQKGIIWTGYRT